MEFPPDSWLSITEWYWSMQCSPPKAFVLVSLGSITGLAGCMGGASLPASQTPQPLSVLFASASPTSLAVQASATLVAAATFPTYVSIGSVNNFVIFQVRPGSGSTLPSIYLAGTALGQGANTGEFTAASVTGSTYVFAAQGTDVRGPLQLAGLLTARTSGTITGTLNWNDLTNTVQSPLPFTGTYTVDPTGRVTVSKIVGLTFGYLFHLYLTGDGNGLLLSNDTADIFNGQAFQQQASPFTAASFSGTYGTQRLHLCDCQGFGSAATRRRQRLHPRDRRQLYQCHRWVCGFGQRLRQLRPVRERHSQCNWHS